MNDDDLPVLTQVLRTGSGRREASIPPPVESLDDALDVRPVEETWMAERLVIGAHPMQSSDGVVGPHVMHDASCLHDADSSQLPQDHDARHAVELDDGSFGAPHMYEAAGSRALDPRVTPIPPQDPASLALRVRDAVLDDLRTRIDTELDARIAQVMHAEVETALAQLQINLRAHLTEALRDVVQRAVDEEAARNAAPARPDDAR